MSLMRISERCVIPLGRIAARVLAVHHAGARRASPLSAPRPPGFADDHTVAPHIFRKRSLAAVLAYRPAPEPGSEAACLPESGCTIRIWDALTGASLQALQGHTDFVRSVAYSRDGKNLASGSSDGTIRIWDTPSETVVRVLFM
eukprot:NODE_16222_length_1005_cov_9.580866.p3 GENE.NODE_16222_length_1005_cov_9.580866~~NODE_16222_length_1005_cov_9.580866.p3  ORF type:complete len:144 (+),score=34.55 NODE_16222_length_1005_cov_9.580866:501-932(+)